MNLMPLMFRSLLLVFALALVLPSYAKELVGKPVALSSAQSSTGAASSANASPTEDVSDLSMLSDDDAATDDVDSPRADKNGRDYHRKNSYSFSRNTDNDHFDPEIIIPIVAIVFGMGLPFLFVVTLIILRHREKERRQQQMNAMIDKFVSAGRDIPPELLRTEEPYIERDDFNLHKGIRNIGLGIGLLIFLTATAGFKVGAVGFILIGLGVSRVIIWKLSGKKVTLDKTQGY